jgi:hypothetical protein
MAGAELFLYSTASRPALGPTQPPAQWIPGALSSEVKLQKCGTDYFLQSSVEVKCVWSYFSNLQCPAALPPGKEPPVPIGWEDGWAPEAIWTTWRKLLTLTGLEFRPLDRSGSLQYVFIAWLSNFKLSQACGIRVVAIMILFIYDLYSGSVSFTSRLSYRPTWLRIFAVFLNFIMQS